MDWIDDGLKISLLITQKADYEATVHACVTLMSDLLAGRCKNHVMRKLYSCTAGRKCDLLHLEREDEYVFYDHTSLCCFETWRTITAFNYFYLCQSMTCIMDCCFETWRTMLLLSVIWYRKIEAVEEIYVPQLCYFTFLWFNKEYFGMLRDVKVKTKNRTILLRYGTQKLK